MKGKTSPPNKNNAKLNKLSPSKLSTFPDSNFQKPSYSNVLDQYLDLPTAKPDASIKYLASLRSSTDSSTFVRKFTYYLCLSYFH